MRKRIVQIMVFLLLGAIVNVAVAWGFALLVNPYEMDEIESSPASDGPSDFAGYVVAKTVAKGTTHYGVYSSAGGDYGRRVNIPRIESRLPAWADRSEFNRFRMHIFNARGWPTLSMWSAMEMDQGLNYTYTIHGGLMCSSLDPIEWSWRSIPQVLPLHVIWPGFAINTIFYAAVLWVVFAFPFVIRRRRRIKRGLCPACAYPIGTSDVCTECGALVAIGSHRV